MKVEQSCSKWHYDWVIREQTKRWELVSNEGKDLTDWECEIYIFDQFDRFAVTGVKGGQTSFDFVVLELKGGQTVFEYLLTRDHNLLCEI